MSPSVIRASVVLFSVIYSYSVVAYSLFCATPMGQQPIDTVKDDSMVQRWGWLWRLHWKYPRSSEQNVQVTTHCVGFRAYADTSTESDTESLSLRPGAFHPEYHTMPSGSVPPRRVCVGSFR